MTIQFTCHGCGRSLEVPDEKAGKVGRCRECGELVRVPIAESGYEFNSCDCITEMPEDAPRRTEEREPISIRRLLALANTPKIQAPVAGSIALLANNRRRIFDGVGWCVGLAGIFLTVVWPSMYRYDRVTYGRVQFLYRINRVTGDQVLLVDPVADRARVEAELEREAARQRAKDEELVIRRQDGNEISFPRGTPWETIRSVMERFENDKGRQR